MHKSSVSKGSKDEKEVLECSKILGDVIKRARGKAGLTQQELSDISGTDRRTIINIENYHKDSKFGSIYEIIRSLKIDSREIFYPEIHRDSPSLRQLRLLIEECNEEEAAAVIPVLESLLSVLRDNNSKPV